MIDWVVDEASLLRSPMGTISGTVLLRVDGIGFPEERWSDFPLPVTVAWLEELFQIASGNRGKREVYFMEGPFRVELKCESRDLVRLTCIERHRIIHHTAVAPVPELRKNAKAAARRLLRECHLRGWSNRDIDALTAINKIP